MTTKTAKIVLLVGFIFLITINISSAEGEEEAALIECKAVLGGVVKKQLGFIKTCLGEMNFTNGKEKSQRMMCVMVCSMKKAGFLDDNGQADAVASMHFLETELPDNLRQRVMELFMECQEHISGLMTAAEDPTCKTFEPMMKCAQSMMNKVCV